MHPLIPLVKLDTSSFSFSVQAEELSSCEEISVRLLNTDMVFQKVDYYESNAGYVSWIGITGSDTYIFPEEYDLLSGMEPYSPAGESVTVTNVGDEVDITTMGFYKPVLKLEDDSQRITYINLYVLVKDSGISGAIVPAHDSKEIYNVHNDSDAVPEFSQLGIVNTGAAELARAYFQTASLTGEFETIVSQDLAINSEQYMDIPQTPVARWRIIIQNDSDVDAKVIYIITDGIKKISRSGVYSG